MVMVRFEDLSRIEVREKFLELIDGRISPEDVAGWAGEWRRVYEDGYDPSQKDRPFDDVIWYALESLALADSQIGKNVYLYNRVDFRNWLTEFDNGVG